MYSTRLHTYYPVTLLLSWFLALLAAQQAASYSKDVIWMPLAGFRLPLSTFSAPPEAVAGNQVMTQVFQMRTNSSTAPTIVSFIFLPVTY